MPNGHELHAHFKKSEQSICNLSAFVKECKHLFGTIIIYSYRGNGIFSAHVFKDDLCEVDYFQRRTIPRAPVFVQGKKLIIIFSRINYKLWFYISPYGKYLRKFDGNYGFVNQTISQEVDGNLW